MTFLKVLRATNVGVRGPLPFGVKFFDLPKFLRHYNTQASTGKFCRAMILQFFPKFLELSRIWGEKFIPRLVVRPCYQRKFSKMLIVIGKSVNPLHISFMLEESNF